MNDAEEIIIVKKNSFKVWSEMVFKKGSDQSKYGELIHAFSIQYAIKNSKYPKTIQEAVDVMRKVKFKAEKNNDKSSTQKQN